MKFEQNLKALRLNRFLTQKEIADALHITKSTYSHYERGSRRPDVDTLYALADFFQVRIDTLFNQQSHRFVSDINFYAAMTAQEEALLHGFCDLSEFAKGRLIERLKMLQEEDAQMFHKNQDLD